MTTSRFAQLECWARNITQQPDLVLELISGDASFRKYYRGAQLIWVDAPPETEKNHEFVTNAQALAFAEIAAPTVKHVDLIQGFLAVSDLGNTSLLSCLSDLTVSDWYCKALALLPSFAKINLDLPEFDRAFMARENTIFPEWFLGKHLALNLSETESDLLNQTFELLAENNLEQPQVVMHRDYHSRNLMVLDDESLAVIDFQDMVRGPITYDAVSLLKDCYCRWPGSVVENGLKTIYQNYRESHLIPDEVTLKQFERWFDLTGMQRHLKAIGIFARLNHRDGKSGYLKDIPRTLGYVLSVCEKYPEFEPFGLWLTQRVSLA